MVLFTFSVLFDLLHLIILFDLCNSGAFVLVLETAHPANILVWTLQAQEKLTFGNTFNWSGGKQNLERFLLSIQKPPGCFAYALFFPCKGKPDFTFQWSAKLEATEWTHKLNITHQHPLPLTSANFTGLLMSKRELGWFPERKQDWNEVPMPNQIPHLCTCGWALIPDQNRPAT